MSNGNGEWMPLYIGDYLGDTMELDGAQHGAYLLLLMYYWRNGSLPTDDSKLAQIARTELRVWRKTVGPVVRAFFHEKDGRLHQKRADLELAKADGISAKRRAAAATRWGNGIAPPPGSGHANADANAPPNADANAMQVDGICIPDADAKGMLRAPGLPLPVPRKKEPPRRSPAEQGTGTPASPGTPPRRENGGNPREIGTNPRAGGTNPRAVGAKFRNGFIQLVAEEGMPSVEETDADLSEKVSEFLNVKGLRYGAG